MQRNPPTGCETPRRPWMNQLVTRDQERSAAEYLIIVGMILLAVIAVGVQFWLFRREAGSPSFSIIGVTGWVLVLLLLVWEWRSRKGPEERHPLEDQADRREPLPAALQERVFAKRQLIYKILASDKRILLESRMEVRHVMTDDLTIVPPTATITQMVEQMNERTIRHLLVCENSRLLGVISDRDLRTRKGDTAAEIMTPDPVTVSPSTLVDWTVTMLIRHGFSCLPVVEGGRLCGLLTSTDLMMTLQCSLKLLEQVIQQVQPEPEAAAVPSNNCVTAGQESTLEPTESGHTLVSPVGSDAVAGECRLETIGLLNR